MRKYFDVDLKTFAVWLLPVSLRVPTVCSFVVSLCTPYIDLYWRFYSNRNKNLYRLAITSQVCYIEKALNDHFDFRYRRIYITGGSIKRRTYIYTRKENFPVMVYTRQENAAIHLYTRDEDNGEKADFIVNVPKSINFDNYEMCALIDMYKLASKTYLIKPF